MAFPIKGSCQCGQVSYLLFEKPSLVIACHCKECQKLSTSAFSVTAIVASSTIHFTGKLKETSRVADSGNTNIGKFCPECGNRINQLNPAQPESIKLKLKPDTNTELFEPSVHVWTSQKVNWYKIPDGVTSMDKQR